MNSKKKYDNTIVAGVCSHLRLCHRLNYGLSSRTQANAGIYVYVPSHTQPLGALLCTGTSSASPFPSHTQPLGAAS